MVLFSGYLMVGRGALMLKKMACCRDMQQAWVWIQKGGLRSLDLVREPIG